MPKQMIELNSLFKALADPTRRAVVERLVAGPASMTELNRPFGMALPSFAQHMELLEASGWVSSKKQGRTRTYELDYQALKAAEGWLDRQKAHWEKRLNQLD